MSFILDALRKSDARRQQGGAPGLNSPEPPRPPRRRRRRLLPLLAAALVVLAVTATAVYIVRPDWLPQGLAGREVADVSVQQAASPQPFADANGRQPEERSATEETGEQLAQQQPEAEASERPTAPSRPPAAEDSASVQEAEKKQPEAQRDRRRPIPASPERTVRRETPQRERESEPVPADDAMEELERRVADQVRRRAESPEPSDDQSEESRQPAERESERPPEPERKRAAEPKPLNEGVAEYLRQWELPLSVRRNLPELNLTIHVFSPVEAERFVLINGERFVPGDAVGEAQIVDISRDGAIVDFRSHRFLLEPR